MLVARLLMLNLRVSGVPYRRCMRWASFQCRVWLNCVTSTHILAVNYPTPPVSPASFRLRRNVNHFSFYFSESSAFHNSALIVNRLQVPWGITSAVFNMPGVPAVERGTPSVGYRSPQSIDSDMNFLRIIIIVVTCSRTVNT